VSNQVFPEDGPVYSPSMQQGPYPGSRWEGDGYEEAPGRRRSDMREVEEEEQSEYTRRYSSTTSPTGPRRGATPEEDLRRMHVREEEVYRGGRASYSGPPSAEPPYYRGQEVTRSPQSSSRATTPSDSGGPVAAAPSASPGLGTVRQGRMLRSPRPPGEQVRPPGDLTLPPVPQASASPAPEGHYQQAQAIVDQHYNNTYRQVDQQLESAQQLVAQRRSNSPQRPYPVRPKNRNSNVLSAILCLIKEIDGPSLEVVEMAVRCRMEELED